MPGRWLISQFCLALMTIVLTACGGGSTPPTPGPIVFYGHPDGELGDGFNNLIVMNPDGTGVRRLTRTDGDVNPSWSPDGTQVVFERAADVEDCVLDACAQIWTVDADGTDERRLTPVTARSEAPDWSPAGDRIVFQRWVEDNYVIDIYVMNVDGSGVRRLTDGSGVNESPVWSPDGERIAFTKEIDGGGPITYEIGVMDAEGNDLPPQLTDRGVESPDGEKIAFVRRRTIVVTNEDGRDERTISRLRSRDALRSFQSLVWSPDSSQIAFVIYDENLGDGEIWVADANGGNAKKLPAGPYTEPWGLDWAAAKD